MAALGSSFVSCTAIGKKFGVRNPVTLIKECPWEVDPGCIPSEAISSCISSKQETITPV